MSNDPVYISGNPGFYAAPTGKLRLIRTSINGPPTLQREWVNLDTGRRGWENVPVSIIRQDEMDAFARSNGPLWGAS